MGHSSDRLAARFGVTRHDCDAWASMSHQRAAAAHEKGLYKDEIVAVDGKVTGKYCADTWVFCLKSLKWVLGLDMWLFL
jgi:acetyl-CoA acetyltransferase